MQNDDIKHILEDPTYFSLVKFLHEIPKTPKKEGVILFGRGPSVDNLHMEMINQQDKYDTCTITDAIKLLKNPTFSFNYHDQGYRRIKSYVRNPKYLIIPIKMIDDFIKKNYEKGLKHLSILNNVYAFVGRNRKDLNFFEHGLFDIEVTDKLFNRHGSVVGAVHFLAGYMGYKKIKYIGFDGGSEYGELVHSNRKQTKIEGAEKDYARSWETIPALLKHYPDVSFKPLTEFLIKGNKKPNE